jgi:uncharacterized coiled-coil protein SlyX
MAQTIKELLVKIQSDVSGLKQGFDQAKKKTDTLGGALKKLKSQFLKVAGAAAFIKFMKDSAEKAAFQELQVKALNKALISTGNAVGMTVEELQNLAAGFQKTTTFGDEAIMSAESILLTFTKIGRDVFPQTVESVLNVSEAMGQDLKSSAVQLGKALNDPTTGLTALQRIGITFSEKQKTVIKQLQKTGDVAKAQKVILEELNVQFGGRAAGAAETYAGKLKQLGNRFGDVQEAIGKVLIEALAPFVEKVIEFVEKHQDALTGAFKLAGEAAGIFLTVLGAVAEAVEDIFGWVSDLTKQLGEFGKAVKEIFSLKGVTSILGGFTGAMESAAEETETFNKNVEKGQKVWDLLAGNAVITKESLNKLSKELGLTSKKFDKFPPKKTITKTKELVKVTDDLADSLGKNLIKALVKEHDALSDSNEEWLNFGMNLEKASKETIDLEKDQNHLAETSKKAAGVVKDETAELEKLNKAFTDGAALISNVTDALMQLGVIGEKVAGILRGVGTGINAIGGGITSIEKKGKGFLGFLNKAQGAVSIFSGALSIASSVLSLFKKKSGELKAAERNIRGLIGVSGEWTKKIEELAKELGGAGSAEKAFAQLLPDIIRDTKITSNNFGEFVDKVRDIGAIFKQGVISADEASTRFGAAFSEMVKAAEGIGELGGVEMTGLIMLVDELGLSVKEVQDFIDSNMKSAVQGWRKVMAEFTGATIPELEEIIRQEDVIASIPDNIKSELEGATEAIIGLSNSGRLTKEQFEAFGLVASDVRQKLEAQGITGKDAIVAMKPLLERIAFLQKEFGLSVDATTQSMIDQGIESGILKKDLRSDTEIMSDGFDEMNAGIRELIGIMKGEMPGAIKSMTGAFRTGATAMAEDVTKWGKSLSEVAGMMKGDVADAIGDMSDAHSDAMEGHSILPEIKEWQKKLDETKAQLEKITAPIRSISDEWSKAMSKVDSDSRLGSKALIGLIQQNERYGNRVKEINDFVKSQLQSGLEGYQKMKGAIDLRGISKELADAKAKVDELASGEKAGGGEHKDAVKNLTAIQKKYDEIALAAEIFGDKNIKVFAQMNQLQDRVAKNQNLVDAIKGWGEQFLSLSSVQKLSKEEFSDFSKVATSSFDALIKQGFNSREALQIIGPQLEQLSFLQKQFGFSVDDSTQKLIDQASEKGIINENFKDDLAIMTEGFEGVIAELIKIGASLQTFQGQPIVRPPAGVLGSGAGTAITGINQNTSAIEPVLSQTKRDYTINIMDAAVITPKMVADLLIFALDNNTSGINSRLGVA